jgi:hypothetical protein
MTSSSPQNPLSDTWRKQCLLYLYGELDAAQVADFESKLASSPDLADELARQTEVICLLSAQLTGSELSSAAEPRKNPVEPAASWKLYAILATAVSILFVGVLMQPAETGKLANQDTNSSRVSDDLLIAQAWLNNHHSVAVESDELNEYPADWVPIDATDLELNLDSTLSWMFAAVSVSNGDDVKQGVGNDG